MVLWLGRLPGLRAEPYTWVFADMGIYSLVYRRFYASVWIMSMAFALALASLSSLMTIHSQPTLPVPVLMPR